MSRPRLGLAVLTALLLGLLAAPASASHDPNDLAPTSVCRVSSPTQLLCLVNWARGHHGLQPLYKMPALYSAAGQKADRINECRQFSHNPCGDGFACIASLYSCGENIATGFPTIRTTFDAWLHSPGHRANILNPGWKFYGSGYRANGYFVKLWVQEFGGASGSENVLGIVLPGPLVCHRNCAPAGRRVG